MQQSEKQELLTLPRNEIFCQLFWGHRYQWISHKMDIRHPWQLKIKILGAVLALPAKQHCQFAQFLGKWAKLAVLFRILIFSIVLGAEYSFYVKSIDTYAPKKVDIIIHSQAVCVQTCTNQFSIVRLAEHTYLALLES